MSGLTTKIVQCLLPHSLACQAKLHPNVQHQNLSTHVNLHVQVAMTVNILQPKTDHVMDIMPFLTQTFDLSGAQSAVWMKPNTSNCLNYVCQVINTMQTSSCNQVTKAADASSLIHLLSAAPCRRLIKKALHHVYTEKVRPETFDRKWPRHSRCMSGFN